MRHPDFDTAPDARVRRVGSQAERVLRLALRLREPLTLDELAGVEGVSSRTIRRDLRVIERVLRVRRHGDHLRIEIPAEGA